MNQLLQRLQAPLLMLPFPLMKEQEKSYCYCVQAGTYLPSTYLHFVRCQQP